MVAYLERCAATLARVDPDLDTLAGLDRRHHIEPYLSAVATAVNHNTGEAITASTQRSRIQAVGRMLEAIAEWDWDEAPTRRLIFDRDSPRLPHPLPRYLPPDADRRLVEALEASPHRFVPTRCCCYGRRGCASVSSSTWNSTAFTRSQGRAPG